MFTLSAGAKVETDENASLCDMEAKCPRFFKTKHGQRETYAVHRGFLIVRNTVKFTHGSERRTTVYLYLPKGYDDSPGPNMSCVSACTNLHGVAQAKRYIDRLIERGHYEYGWQNKRMYEVSWTKTDPYMREGLLVKAIKDAFTALNVVVYDCIVTVSNHMTGTAHVLVSESVVNESLECYGVTIEIDRELEASPFLINV